MQKINIKIFCFLSQILGPVFPVPKQTTLLLALPSDSTPSQSSLAPCPYSILALGGRSSCRRFTCSVHFWQHFQISWFVPSSPTWCRMFSLRAGSVLVTPADVARVSFVHPQYVVPPPFSATQCYLCTDHITKSFLPYSPTPLVHIPFLLI